MSHQLVRRWLLFTSASVMLLTGCTGGGGAVSYSSASRDTVVFSSFSALQPNENVRASGVSQSATLTVNTATDLVTNTVLDTVDTTNTYLTLGFNNSVALDGLRVESATTDLSWSTALGDSIDDKGVIFEISDSGATSTMVLGDATDSWVNWNYQTFGVWQNTTVSGPTSTVEVGAISAGSPSPVSGIPTSGTAIYVGQSAGLYVDASGELYNTSASVTSTADFLNRALSFDTAGMTTVHATSGTSTSASNLNLTGTLYYGVSSNQFSGTIKSADDSLNGTATGYFYGPNAEEIGGTYKLTGSGPLETMIGGFGAKR